MSVKKSRKTVAPAEVVPEGVAVVSLDNPAQLHNVIAEAVGEPPVFQEQPAEQPTEQPKAETVTVELTSAYPLTYIVGNHAVTGLRNLDASKVLSYSIDPDTRIATVTLSAKQAKAWKVG